ncbi:hypothetical protein MSKU15_2250 [Komagataeibacter diospyri]|uniref:Uncharacterized protein n=1 Tax=Komagataeibacter diospyri TaxID=1932662 RepID=A0A4P5NQ40_9PROT|nr:hypothetical protein MSKU9_1891 [Komagataeibacter diospyri]GCE90649.1 hypothetical protein MSKU15_2250 [Komagataeibacter diospyri]
MAWRFCPCGGTSQTGQAELTGNSNIIESVFDRDLDRLTHALPYGITGTVYEWG